MKDLTKGKSRRAHLIVLGLIAAIFGVVGFVSYRMVARAQSFENILYFPLVFKNALLLPEESIMILSPASGSAVTSPIHIEGISDPTFEKNLIVRVLQADGTLVAEAPTTIQADLGQRGPFEIDLPVSLSSEQNIFIQVFATSARDGGVTHLSSVGVNFTPTGTENIIERSPYPEHIAIFEPQITDTISGGSVEVSGFGLASFEQTLLIEVLDEDGDVVGSESVIVDSPGLGESGPFEVTVEYDVDDAGPGRIVIRDISPAFGGDSHLSSVEVNLEP